MAAVVGASGVEDLHHLFRQQLGEVLARERLRFRAIGRSSER